MSDFKLYFDQRRPFDIQNVRRYKGIVGLYFIYNDEIKIRYPFSESRLIYIGMSEKRTNSIGNRLQSHLEGRTGNEGISSYKSVNEVSFTVLNYQMVKTIWPLTIEFLESYFILDFVKNYGVYPICNNKTGNEVLTAKSTPSLNIVWEFFE